jgi:hypothetical protein
LQCSDPDGGVAVAPRRETRPPQGAIAGAAADRADGQREAVISRLAGENERSGLPCDRRYAGLVPSVPILYVLWVAITYVLEGFPKTLLRPEAQALRTTYTISANLIVGTLGSMFGAETRGRGLRRGWVRRHSGGRCRYRCGKHSLPYIDTAGWCVDPIFTE